jgi:putative transposase
MPSHLKRYSGAGDLHFVTFSCYDRRPFLRTPQARDLFLHIMEEERSVRSLYIAGYIVMPEHVHLLIGEPESGEIATFLKITKQRFGRRAHESGIVPSNTPVWQRRYYDFNVFTERKRVEKLKYMHRNPVARGLVERPEDWLWSSFRFYRLGESHIVFMSKKVEDYAFGRSV